MLRGVLVPQHRQLDDGHLRFGEHAHHRNEDAVVPTSFGIGPHFDTGIPQQLHDLRRHAGLSWCRVLVLVGLRRETAVVEEQRTGGRGADGHHILLPMGGGHHDGPRQSARKRLAEGRKEGGNLGLLPQQGHRTPAVIDVDARHQPSCRGDLGVFRPAAAGSHHKPSATSRRRPLTGASAAQAALEEAHGIRGCARRTAEPSQGATET
mmetsp:Transcript_96449/g.277024  ORF Transcript_96449/g.277024 Transcript_96449/m.277024 type:complete len:208 (+) Transcript_96449:517-1140(+)